MRPDGTVVSRLPPALYDPGWAPDGRLLAGFDHGRLVVVDLRGRERRLMVHAGEEARAPTWSPDGRLIAFVNRIGESYFVEFVDVRSGKPVERWHPGGGFEGADPSWDATGVYIPNA